MAINQSVLGTGLRFPLKRVSSDFQYSMGDDLVFSSIPYILETQANGPGIQGEIPWDSGFGSQLNRLKHKNIITDNDAMNEIARHYVIESLFANEPRLLVADVNANFVSGISGNRLDILVRVALLETNAALSDVVINSNTVIAVTFPI